jgi:polyhydroxyalkanoate synthase
MGGTLATLFTALRPELVTSLTLLAAPLDFGTRASLLNVWTDRRFFDVDAFIAAHGNCPAWFLQGCFLQMKPVQNFVEKNLALYEQLEDPSFVTNYLAMERWINDNVPVAGETFRQFVKELYQENRLVRGSLLLGDVRVELARVTCPVLLLTATADHLVPPASTEGIRAHLGSQDVTALSVAAGHVGLVVSGKAHRTLWPQATAWLEDRSTSTDTGVVAAPGPLAPPTLAEVV